MNRQTHIAVVVPTVYPVPDLLGSLKQFSDHFEARGCEVHLVVVDDTGGCHPHKEQFAHWAVNAKHRYYIESPANEGQHPATWAGLRALPHVDYCWIMDDDVAWRNDWPTSLEHLLDRGEELLYLVPDQFPLGERLKVMVLRSTAWLAFGKLPPARGSSQRLLKGALLTRCLSDPSTDPYLDARLWRLAIGMGYHVIAYEKIKRARGGLHYSLRRRIALLWCAFMALPASCRKRALQLSPLLLPFVALLFGAPGYGVLLAASPALGGLALTLWLRPCTQLPHDHTVQ
jgi:hypothetical protein